jgi:hypothetical protein
MLIHSTDPSKNNTSHVFTMPASSSYGGWWQAFEGATVMPGSVWLCMCWRELL